jgi:hypothetical protein
MCSIYLNVLSLTSWRSGQEEGVTHVSRFKIIMPPLIFHLKSSENNAVACVEASNLAWTGGAWWWFGLGFPFILSACKEQPRCIYLNHITFFGSAKAEYWKNPGRNIDEMVVKLAALLFENYWHKKLNQGFLTLHTCMNGKMVRGWILWFETQDLDWGYNCFFVFYVAYIH